MSIRDIQLAQQARDENFEKRRVIVKGTIRSIDGATEYLPNFTWVSEYNRPESVFPALNKTGLSIAGTPVLLARNPQQGKPYEFEIIDVSMENILETETVRASRFFVGTHAENHQYPTEADIGPDPVLTFQPALQNLKTVPSTGLTIDVKPSIYNSDGIGREFPGQTVDLSTSEPAAGLIRKVLVYLSVSTNTIFTVDGTAVIDNGAIPIPPPEPPNPKTDRLSAYVLISGGQTSISLVTDIIDIRDFIGTGGDVPEFEATQVGQVLYSVDGLNFTAELPLTNDAGWMVNVDGILMIVG